MFLPKQGSSGAVPTIWGSVDSCPWVCFYGLSKKLLEPFWQDIYGDLCRFFSWYISEQHGNWETNTEKDNMWEIAQDLGKQIRKLS